MSQQSLALLNEQKRSWKLLAENLKSLQAAQTRTYEFEASQVADASASRAPQAAVRFVVRTQFNPGRLSSVSAKVDPASVGKRPCFLCADNRPDEQLELPCGDEFVLLCNPYPIFPEHFTIVHRQHRPQRISDSFAAMLRLSQKLGRRYQVFYNGPRCGASAPDHMHLQAADRGHMPIDAEYDRIKRPLLQCNGASMFVDAGYLRRFISIESENADSVQACFTATYDALRRLTGDEDEPMMNLIVSHERGTYRAVVFPRARHRPSFYFGDDESRLLLSPGTVDLGGLVITPRRQDFDRLTAAHLAEMFQQVTVPPHAFAQLCDALKERLASL
ncbi:DUF4922 domain-containing protein [Fontivita pretiosa]|uniref:DUF4922 domain-containing protein n=1 Tax=Fontivita pretiosa TaxID=2989684 RepID=UPI003D184DB9